MKLLMISLFLSLAFISVSCNFTVDGTVMDTPAWEKTADEVEMSTNDVLAEANINLDKIANLQTETMTFENTVKALDDTFYMVSNVWNRIEVLANASINKEIRDRANNMTIKIQDWYVDAESRKDLYIAIQNYANTQPQLEGEDKKLLDNTIRDYKRIGFHLPEEMQAEIKLIKKELSSIQTQISNNIKAENNNLILLTTEDVEGIPATILSDLKKDENGNYRIRAGVSFETTAIITNSPKEEIRKKVFTAQNSRAQKINKPLMETVIKNKAKLAKMLGYQTWADYMIEPKMAKNGKTAIDFVQGLKEGLEPKFQKEVETLRQLKVKETGDKNASINAWDSSYYTQILQREQFNLDLESLKKYFKYENVLNGMFKIYENLFSLTIEEMDENYYTWAPGVKLMKISDSRDGRPLGLMYLDMFPRPADEKYGHFAMFTIRSGKEITKGLYRRPVVSLICNFPEATSDKPSLLSFRDVETLFHEFGHGLHGILTEAKYSTFAGTNVARDFVEVPSQLLENWVNNKAVLDTFAVNYLDPSDKFPADALDKIKESTLATIGMFYRRQLSFGTMDLKLHSEITEDQDFNIVDYTNKVLKNVYLPYPEGSSFITNFGHLFGGYDAGYYGYAWADNIAADMASLFENSPNGYFDREIGMRVREEIYQTGSTREIKTSVKALLGRDSNNEAFLKKLGL